MARVMSDCRKLPSELNCTLVISGEEDEVVRAAAIHAVDFHEEEDTPELRELIRKNLEPEPAALSRSARAEQRA